jgi:ketosteroid isomerase-like protein
MKLAWLAIAASIFLPSSANQSANTNEEVKQVIIKKYEKMRVSLKNGDATYVLGMHTADAILFLPNGKEVVGMVVLKPFYEKVAMADIDINSTPTSVELLADDIAYEVGTFVSTSKTGIQNSAKYINIWKKVDGDWKIYKAIDQTKLVIK